MIVRINKLNINTKNSIDVFLNNTNNILPKTIDYTMISRTTDDDLQ